MKKEVKAQAAMEFLMTYGWVILVAIVALGALAYFGVFNLQLLLPEKCVIEATSGLFCDDFTADDSPRIALIIKNVLKKDVNVEWIEIVTNEGMSCLDRYEGGAGVIPSESSNEFTITTGCEFLEAGDKIRGTINIEYSREGGLERTAAGTLTLYVNAVAESSEPGICQNAEDGCLCGGLDFLFGGGYRESCCTEYSICCEWCGDGSCDGPPCETPELCPEDC